MQKSLILVASLLYSPAMAQTAAPSAQDFVTKVAISDMFEIQSSQLALTKQADRYQALRREDDQDHQKTSSELKALVDGGKVKATLPTALNSQHQKMLDELKAKNDFDASYDQTQLKAHQDAVALFEAYAKSGDNAELKGWAGQTLPHLKEHLRRRKSSNSTFVCSDARTCFSSPQPGKPSLGFC